MTAECEPEKEKPKGKQTTHKKRGEIFLSSPFVNAGREQKDNAEGATENFL